MTDTTTDTTVRIDRWLSAARIFKSRTQARDACEGGLVRVNGVPARASHNLKIGDEVRAHAPRGPLVLIVLKIAPKRLGPGPARELYEDRSPPPLPREAQAFARERGAGRPTKAERRALDRFRVRGT